MQRTFMVIAAAVLIAGCGSGEGLVDPIEPPPPPGPPIVSRLTCSDNQENTFQCDLELAARGGFSVELRSTSCSAPGNTLRITKPEVRVLTSDACRAAHGTVWAFAGPYETGTDIALEIVSARLQFPPVLRVDGAHPLWTLTFEDGGDQDFDDIILVVRATT